MKNRCLPTAWLFSLFVLWGLSSCIAEDLSGDSIINQDGLKEGYMKIELNLPDFYIPTDAGATTKAMDAKAEALITKDGLSVLVFKQDGASRKFYYRAPVTALEPVDGEPNKANATIKLVKSKDATEKFDIVVIANHTIDESTLIKDATKESILNALIYHMPTGGKWNATTGSSTPFPMYGKKDDVKIEENMLVTKITLYRALARIDVGLNFKSGTDGKLLEEAEGLETKNFKLKEVLVYRTNDQGCVVGNSDPAIVMPGQDIPVNVPGDAKKNKDPLHYILDSDQTQKNAFIREIYVPESDFVPEPNDAHCIVVGGIFTDTEGNEVESYYRLDFARRNNPKEIDSLAIIRNHRYVFNIIDIKHAGAKSPEEALKEGFNPSQEGFEYKLIVWDESIHEMHFHGEYYFGLDNRELTFEPKASHSDPKNVHLIKYQTNYPISDSDGLVFEWEKGGLFQAEWVTKGSKGEIKLTALTTNETNTILSDVLTVKLGSFIIPVKVNQNYINFKYTIDCASVVVSGTYRPGHTLNTTHYITLDITAADVSINGTDYIIETEPINGIVFKGKGTFNVTAANLTVKNIKLVGSGILNTPDDARTDPFTVTINSNSSSGSYCEATITPVIAKMNVLSIASGGDRGYNIADTGGASYKVLKHPSNFGPNDDSRVKIEDLNLIKCTNVGFFHTDAEAKKWLTGESNGGKIADIVHIAYISTNSSPAALQMLVQYMKKGGVIIGLLQEDAGSVAITNYIMQEIYNDNNITAIPATGAGSLYAFPGHKIYEDVYAPKDAEDSWYKYYDALQNDPIMNGPFGDMRDKQWGEDASVTRALHNITAIEADAWDFTKTDEENKDKHTVIYSRATNLNVSSSPTTNNNITGLKYESDTYNIAWFGDGGFTSHTGGVTGGTLAIDCPFAYDANWFPVPRPTKYGSNRRYQPYNAPIFCNTMAWAIQRADSPELRAKKDKLLGK